VTTTVPEDVNGDDEHYSATSAWSNQSLSTLDLVLVGKQKITLELIVDAHTRCILGIHLRQAC
jgi:hypothetical protein